MKKIFSFLICTFFVIQLSAQWHVGPRAGVNFCSITGKWSDDDETKYKWIGGPVGGATGGYSFNQLFSLNADLMYINMGEKSVNTYEDKARQSGATTYTFKEYFNCMQLAILAQFLFGTNLQFICFVGPFMVMKYGGFAIISDGTTTQRLNLLWDTPPVRGSGDDYYIDPEYNRRWSHGIYFGGGVGKDVGPGKIVLDARFGVGLNDLNKFESKEDRQDARDNGYRPYRSLNAAITVAYLFKLGGK
jgi:hypothetical protein